jgi:hypothetical protein
LSDSRNRLSCRTTAAGACSASMSEPKVSMPLAVEMTAAASTWPMPSLARRSLALRFRNNSNTLWNQIVLRGKCPSA